VPTTGGRSRGRRGMRPAAHPAVAEHLSKIVAALVAALVLVAFVLVITPAGHDIDAATQRFMLFYAGVFALLGLTGSVLVGLIATDRVFMTPGHRVLAQAVHRAFSFGALAFLVIHIVTEILAQRVHVIDAFIPFLSPFRTFYIGLGTIASDLILLVVVSSILRKRFTAHGRAWRWRAIHYSAYAAFVLGVLHGLLGGRTAKPYVDWSYGLAIALTALGLVVRFLATSLRSKESLSAPPGAERAGASAAHRSSPLHAAAMSMAQAQLGTTIQVLPGGMGLPGAGPRTALPPAQGWSPTSGPLPALGAAPAYGAAPVYGARPALGAAPAYAGEAAYADLGFIPLGAPPYGDGVPATGSRPYAGPDAPRPALNGPGRPPGPVGPLGPGQRARQPLYEPGYDGPPRFVGAPRGHLPQDDVSSYPYGAREQQGARPYRDGGRPRTGAHRSQGPYGPSQVTRGDRNTGPMPRADSGPMPRADSGPMPRADSGPMPRLGSGPPPRGGTGPMPRLGSGPVPGAGSGSRPRGGTGPMPRAATGPMPRVDAGPSGPAGPMPRANPAGRPDVPADGPGTRPMPRPAGRSPRPARPARPARRPDSGDPRYREPRSDWSDEWE
jgi:DMSO/TMAO reductase YedYZ heme-binding membrane subunit